MALQSSGAISLANIQTEFGGSNPISLSEYYAGGSYVPSGTSGTNGAVPTSGTISFNQFYGTSAIPSGQVEYTTPGTYFFIVPAGVTSVCAVVVGGGSGGPSGGRYSGGAGGALVYKNNISVTPGTRLKVTVGAGGAGGVATTSAVTAKWGQVGGTSSLAWNEGPNPGAFQATMAATGGESTYWGSNTYGGIGIATYDGGGSGGFGKWAPTISGFAGIGWGGGGGAAGYTGPGGDGAPVAGALGGASGSGGGGGGGMYAGGNDEGQDPYTSTWGRGASTGGGGVGIYGQGSNGVGGTYASPIITGGGGGSGGQTASSRTLNNWSYDAGEDGGPGGAYGGGGAPGSAWVRYSLWRKGGDGGGGAVRIIWGPGRSFPSINTGNV